MKSTTIEEVAQTYGIENWGAGYFGINRQGHLIVRPAKGDTKEADVFEIVQDLVEQRKLSSPFLLRFPQILESQLNRLCLAYEAAAKEYEFSGGHFPVFPMKVNPRREVVETFLRDGVKQSIGLEAGSKAELYAALSLEQPPESLLICNGFKDETFIRLALLGVQAGKRVVVVVEKLNELKMIIRLAKETGVTPLIGLRAKLYSRGSGKWAASGGEAAKFGLTTSEILECIRLLRADGMIESLKLMHFHIGSQITDVKRVKNAMKEAARVYAKIRQMKVEIEYLDIGGGLGVDYDGSKTTFEASINYTVEEFANNVVYMIKSVCDDEKVPHPHLVTESGRVMTAYHAIFVTSIRDEIETFAEDIAVADIDDDDPQVIYELKSLLDGINSKNFREYYHDALDDKDELHTQFNLGLVSLEDRAKGEVLFWEICSKALQFAHAAELHDDEFEALRRILASKYLCNFSLFRSAPDAWAIGQLFPIMPIHKLDETPTDFATLVDVTCDSDGCIKKFVDLKDVKQVLELHDFNALKPNEPYYLAIFLVGAYQEVMGSFHNLFGLPNEAQIVIDADGRYHVTKLVPASKISDMLSFARYDKTQCVENFRRLLSSQINIGKLDASKASDAIQQYEAAVGGSTYLE
ncbi:MAG: biosynthetic arginine decarboxylase [Planctomycetia bacterium]|nr:biosynthetic arginine decarboxylase [Planctomycetia bacterium]